MVSRLTVFVLGNEFFEPDALALKVSRRLEKKMRARGVRFKKVSDAAELFKKRARPAVILDVVKGVKKVTVFETPKRYVVGKRVSAHDFDYGFLAKIMSAVGESPRALVIGIPFGCEEEKAAREVEKVIKEKLPKVFGVKKRM